MFPLVHIYCTKRIVDNASPLLLFGSIFPDIEALGLLGYGTINDSVNEFSAYVKENNSVLSDFGEGLLYHEEPCGVDRFVHGDAGYAFVKGREIVPFVEKYFPEGALVKSHNYVELAVQILMVGKYPELQDEMIPVLEASRNVTDKIARIVSDFYSVDYQKTLDAIKLQDELLSTMDFSSLDSAVSWYTGFSNRMRNANYSDEVIKAILEKAIDVIKDDYEDFIEGAIKKCKKD